MSTKYRGGRKGEEEQEKDGKEDLKQMDINGNG